MKKYLLIFLLIAISTFGLLSQNNNELDKRLGFQNIKLYISVEKYYSKRFKIGQGIVQTPPTGKEFYTPILPDIYVDGTSEYHIGSIPVYPKLVVDYDTKIIEEIWIENIPYSKDILIALEELYGSTVRPPLSELIADNTKFDKNSKKVLYWCGSKLILIYIEHLDLYSGKEVISLFYRIPSQIKKNIYKPAKQDIKKIKTDM